MNLYDMILKDGRPQLYLLRTPTSEKEYILKDCDVANVCRKEFSLDKKAEEYMYMFAVNIKGRILGAFEIAHGTVSECVACPREFLIRLLLLGATEFVVVHNHPSEDPTPSKEDLKFTRRLADVGNMVGIRLRDHVILGGTNHYSMWRENRELFF